MKRTITIVLLIGVLISVFFLTETFAQEVPTNTLGKQDPGKFILLGVEDKTRQGLDTTLKCLGNFLNESPTDENLAYFSQVNYQDVMIRIEKIDIIGEVGKNSANDYFYKHAKPIKLFGKDFNLKINYNNANNLRYYIVLAYVTFDSGAGYQPYSLVIPGIYGYNQKNSGFSIDMGVYFGHGTSQVYVKTDKEAAELQAMMVLTALLKNIKSDMPIKEFYQGYADLTAYQNEEIGTVYTLYRCGWGPELKLITVQILKKDIKNNRVIFQCLNKYYRFGYILPCDEYRRGQ